MGKSPPALSVALTKGFASQMGKSSSSQASRNSKELETHGSITIVCLVRGEYHVLPRIEPRTVQESGLVISSKTCGEFQMCLKSHTVHATKMKNEDLKGLKGQNCAT